jgi:hypothetical protein
MFALQTREDATQAGDRPDCKSGLARYIHLKSVKAGLVDEPWEYRYSSARDYMNNLKGLLEVELI